MNVRQLKPSGTVLMAAIALVIGLEVPAMAHQVSVAAHQISGTSIKEHSIVGDRMRDNTLTGTQIEESTLGRVPKATEAFALAPLTWHEITAFKAGWHNTGDGRQHAAYAVDAQRIVRLRGSIAGGSPGTVAFTLPASVESVSVTLAVPVVVGGGEIGYVELTHRGIEPQDGDAASGSVTIDASLAGVAFPAS
jgi:hypothetical protein